MRTKAVALFLLLAFSTPIFLHPEARPITLPTGEAGFFLTREDMEKAVFAMEKVSLLEQEIGTLKKIISDLEKEKQLLSTLFPIVGIGGPALGFFLGLLVK